MLDAKVAKHMLLDAHIEIREVAPETYTCFNGLTQEQA
jgi:hypothetical protein